MKMPCWYFGTFTRKKSLVCVEEQKQREILAENFISMHEQAELPVGQPQIPCPKAVSDEEDEEKEICAACWTCGNTLCTGYIDGDVWIWSIPSVTTDDSGISCPFISGEPLRKLDTLPGKSTRMPIFVMAWSGDLRASKSGGRLYLVGGREVGSPEVLTVLPLDGNTNSAKLPRLELLLHGPFRDLALLPNPGGASIAALVVLTSPGQLHLYDEAGIASCFSSQNESGSSSSLVPVTWPAPLPSTTAIKFALLPQQSAAYSILPQQRRCALFVASWNTVANNWREDELLFLIVKAGLATHNSNHGPQERAGTDVGYLHVNVATSSGRRNTDRNRSKPSFSFGFLSIFTELGSGQ
ncbi:uncharacterized protein [Physcomitrium patens]